jgi:hypothetical protein
MKKVRIRISTDGKATVSVEGVQGPACVELTKAFEEAIGEVQERQFCKEYQEEITEQTSEQTAETI